MTADQYPDRPDNAGRRDGRRSAASTGHFHTLKSAGLIFSGVALSLTGVFAVVEYSARQSRAMVDADIRTVTTRLDTQHEAITGLGDRVGRLEASVDNRFARVDQRFDKIDERFEKIEERFEKLETKFESKFEQLEAKFDSKFERLETKFDGKFERLETKVDQKLDSITELLIQLVDQKASTTPPASGAGAAKRPR
jgi:hypothetical protein